MWLKKRTSLVGPSKDLSRVTLFAARSWSPLLMGLQGKMRLIWFSFVLNANLVSVGCHFCRASGIKTTFFPQQMCVRILLSSLALGQCEDGWKLSSPRRSVVPAFWAPIWFCGSVGGDVRALRPTTTVCMAKSMVGSPKERKGDISWFRTRLVVLLRDPT